MKQVLLLFFCCLYCRLPAQPPGNLEVRPLSIGDTVPELTITGVRNIPSGTLRLADYRGSWLLLDFWFGACPACIEAFPKLEELEAYFKGKVRFVLVNFESPRQIEATFRRWRKISSNYRWPDLPVVVSDTVLRRLFPHQYYPHSVWIDPQGVVRAFTGAGEVTKANLAAAVRGQLPRLEQKHDMVGYDDWARPLFSQLYPLYPEKLRYYSVVMGYVGGIAGGWARQIIDTQRRTVRVTRRNQSIPALFSDALGGPTDLFSSPRFDFGKRVELRVGDSSRYLFREGQGMSRENWQEENCYSYEAVLPLKEKEKAGEKMLRDLEGYFGTSCRIERQERWCWTLVRTSGSDRIAARKASLPAEQDTSFLYLRSAIVPWLLDKIAVANRATPYLFADETGYKGRIDVVIPKNLLEDLPRLRAYLRRHYDLDLVEKQAVVDVLVLEENRKDPARP